MFIALSTINILLLFWLAFMLIINLFQPKSRAQMAFILFDVFVMVFVFGMEMELLHSSTVDAALSGLAMQYFGQCGFLMAILWFTNEFINLKLPRGVFVIQIIISIFTMFGVMTAGLNKLFYTRMVILHEGLYARISCDNGILWYVHYGYFMIVFLAIIVFCILKYHTMGPIHRKRILYMAVGLGILATELILKALGLFGAYNPVTIALTGTVMCLMLAVMKEGYFESVDATMENVLNHGDEGLIVLDAWSRVVFVNNCGYNLFPDIRNGYPLSAQKSLSAIMEKKKNI